MNEIEIEARLEKLSARHVALGGQGLSIVINPGRWSVTSAGGSPKITASGVTADAAIEEAKAQIVHLEQIFKMAARTIGIEAVQ